jgi:hypothetical protein
MEGKSRPRCTVVPCCGEAQGGTAAGGVSSGELERKKKITRLGGVQKK